MRAAKLGHVRKLVAAIDAGSLSDDGANALCEVEELLEEFVLNSRDVIERWEAGDLAEAVRHLAKTLRAAEGSGKAKP